MTAFTSCKPTLHMFTFSDILSILAYFRMRCIDNENVDDQDVNLTIDDETESSDEIEHPLINNELSNE